MFNIVDFMVCLKDIISETDRKNIVLSPREEIFINDYYVYDFCCKRYIKQFGRSNVLFYDVNRLNDNFISLVFEWVYEVSEKVEDYYYKIKLKDSFRGSGVYNEEEAKYFNNFYNTVSKNGCCVSEIRYHDAKNIIYAHPKIVQKCLGFLSQSAKSVSVVNVFYRGEVTISIDGCNFIEDVPDRYLKDWTVRPRLEKKDVDLKINFNYVDKEDRKETIDFLTEKIKFGLGLNVETVSNSVKGNEGGLFLCSERLWK